MVSTTVLPPVAVPALCYEVTGVDHGLVLTYQIPRLVNRNRTVINQAEGY